MTYAVYVVQYDIRYVCTNTDGAIHMLVPVMSPPRPPPERANVPTYNSWGKSRL
jgi:hypothetical protein